MAHVRKVLPAYPGVGELRCRSFSGQVAYEVLGEASSLKYGPARLRGSLSADPEIAEKVFRDGEGVLTLESGSRFRITMLGYTAGADRAYFEMRV